MLGFLARRAVPGVEEVVDGAYRRSVRLPEGGRVLDLRPDEPTPHAREVFDLDRDMRPVLDALGGDPVIGHLVRAAPDRRVPGTVDGHELAVRAVLGQQVSLAAAATLAARLVAAYGEPLAEPRGSVTHLFPTPAALAGADPERLTMPRSRARALVGLARALADGMTLEREALLTLPGIGPWTAEYVAMRALRDPDAFPATDLGVRHALARLGADVSVSERWRPYRAYAVPHLWASL